MAHARPCCSSRSAAGPTRPGVGERSGIGQEDGTGEGHRHNDPKTEIAGVGHQFEADQNGDARFENRALPPDFRDTAQHLRIGPLQKGAHDQGGGGQPNQPAEECPVLGILSQLEGPVVCV